MSDIIAHAAFLSGWLFRCIYYNKCTLVLYFCSHYVLLDVYTLSSYRSQQAMDQQEAAQLSAINQAGSEEAESTTKTLRETERALESSRAECRDLEGRYIYS